MTLERSKGAKGSERDGKAAHVGDGPLPSSERGAAEGRGDVPVARNVHMVLKRTSEKESEAEMALQDGGKRRRIAFVGVDGSGKTVLMAAFAAQYETPDGDGYFLAAEDVKTFQTVKAVMGRMQNGNWPNKTVNQTVYEFNWSLCRREGTQCDRKLLCSQGTCAAHQTQTDLLAHDAQGASDAGDRR